MSKDGRRGGDAPVARKRQVQVHRPCNSLRSRRKPGQGSARLYSSNSDPSGELIALRRGERANFVQIRARREEFLITRDDQRPRRPARSSKAPFNDSTQARVRRLVPSSEFSRSTDASSRVSTLKKRQPIKRFL